MDALREILDIARWAPSGDNTQPWRFSIDSPNRLSIHAFDTRDHVVYDLEGHASHLAHGALLQSIVYAASTKGCAVEWELRAGSRKEQPVYDVFLTESPTVEPHPLAQYIPHRSTQRRPMSAKRLDTSQKQVLESAAGVGYEIKWWETVGERYRFAKFLFHAARLRLITPEAFEVHRKIIDWGVSDSTDKIPETAVGMSPFSLKLSQWTFKSWRRMKMMNALPGATWFPRLELDFLPGLFCGAHYALFADSPPQSDLDFVRAGMAVQRVWLQAAALGLQQQPEMTPLIFRNYVEKGIAHTQDRSAAQAAVRFVEYDFWQQIGKDEFSRLCWMARLGSRPPKTRSTRLSLHELTQIGTETKR